jgi:hypothetical protein
MNNKINVLLILTGLFFYQLPGSAQTASYSGTWQLNFEKSKLEHRPNGLTTSMFVITQQDDKFRLTRYHIFGDKKKKISFQTVADGKTRRVKLLFKCKLEWKGKDLLVTLWRKNFSNVVYYKYGSTENELIADEVFKSKPSSHHNIWVFDRVVHSN